MYSTIVCGVMPVDTALIAATHAKALAETFDAALHLVVTFEGSADPDDRAGKGPLGRHEAESFLEPEFGSLPYARG